MSKTLSFIFIAMMSPMLPSFFFFIGVKLTYIDFYEITEYYNIIFVDNISWIFYGVSGIIFATLFALPYKKIAGGVLAVATLSSFIMFMPSVALDVSHKMFAKENFHIKKGRWIYSGVLLYEGRENYYLLNDDTKIVMTFQKDKIDEAY